jgi:hypothetical protein
MKPKEFDKFIARDYGCIHCGEVEAAAPHHRLNRGMGGSKNRDNPANIIVLCSVLNGALESNAVYAQKARKLGWKLSAGQNSAEVAVWYPKYQSWFMLDDDFGRRLVSNSPVVSVDKLGF